MTSQGAAAAAEPLDCLPRHPNPAVLAAQVQARLELVLELAAAGDEAGLRAIFAERSQVDAFAIDPPLTPPGNGAREAVGSPARGFAPIVQQFEGFTVRLDPISLVGVLRDDSGRETAGVGPLLRQARPREGVGVSFAGGGKAVIDCETGQVLRLLLSPFPH